MTRECPVPFGAAQHDEQARLAGPDPWRTTASKLASDSLEERRGAFSALRAAGAPAAPALLITLGSPVVRARKLSARLLGEIGDSQAAPALAARLEDPSPSVRRAAAFALRSTPLVTAAPRLIALLGERSRRTRHAAAHGLACLGEAAWPYLEEAAVAPSWRVREAVARLARVLGGPPALALARMLAADRHHRVRGTARWATRRLVRRRRPRTSRA